MITIKIFHGEKKEVSHFHDIDKFAQWLNLYWKKFDHFEYMDSKKPSEKTVFKSKHSFEEYHKKVKGSKI